MVNGDVLEMRLITMSAGYDDFSVTQEEGFPPEEMEFRIVQASRRNVSLSSNNSFITTVMVYPLSI